MSASADPAHRHGGPGAGWYRPAGEGWQRISDAEAAAQRYPDMAHFMHDPNEDQASADLVRAILEAVCERDGIPLESSAEPGEPARNYELALRLKIGKVFGLRETEGSDHGRMDDGQKSS